MPRQPWLADVVADAFRGVKGFRVDTYPGWQSRGSTIFNPNHVMDHHTGPGAYNALLRYMAEGPVHPPLCNIATSRPDNGIVRITLVAAGRANHAGRGSFRTIPHDQGNRYSIGIEHMNDGRQPWPAQQHEAMRRLDAALLRHLGHGTNFLLDHKTYAPTRKVDRHTINVATERVEVTRLLEAPTDPLEELLMSLPDDHPLRRLADNPALAERVVNLVSTLNSLNAAERLGEFGRAMAEDADNGRTEGWGSSVFRLAVIGRHRAMTRAGVEDDDLALLRGLRDGIANMRPGETLDDFRQAGQSAIMAALALWRESQARGWLRDWDKFRENREYTQDDV